ncbi:Tat pathway signal protein [Halosegnis marinus]|uniref:Tat pathway signal protein n=1 Tax=Halosegnis marinus TaxID=3034023 RepID=UPI003605FDC5
MNRRRFLALAGSSALLAGCADTTDPATATPTPTAASDLPDGVYVQPYREGMAMQGTADAGDLRVAFMYTSPHRFWNVNGNEVSLTERSGNVHAMAAVWEPETGRVVPETGLSLEIERDGDLVSQEVIYPMLSQRMGYHYGGNFDLSGGDGTAADGEYTARVSVGGVPDAVALTGAYEGRFRAPATAEIPFVFDEEQRERVRSEEIDAYGQPGAVRPMDMMMPQAVAPPRDALPGTVFGAPNRDDALLATGAVSGRRPPASARTPTSTSRRAPATTASNCRRWRCRRPSAGRPSNSGGPSTPSSASTTGPRSASSRAISSSRQGCRRRSRATRGTSARSWRCRPRR